MGHFFGSCLLSLRVTCYVLRGFRNSSLISVHIIIQLSLLLSLSKCIRLRQYYEFSFIVRDLRHILSVRLKSTENKVIITSYDSKMQIC